MADQSNNVATTERPIDPYIDDENEYLQAAAGNLPLSDEELTKYRKAKFGGLPLEKIKEVLEDRVAIPTLPELNPDSENAPELVQNFGPPHHYGRNK